MSRTISTADEYDAAAERVRRLNGKPSGDADAAELSELIVAMQAWEKAQEALDKRASAEDEVGPPNG